MCCLKEKLVKGLEDPDEDVRAAAFQFLDKFRRHLPGDLETGDLKLKLVKGLEDHVAKVRAAAFRSLEQSPSLEDLATHDLKLKLVKGLEDRVAKVRAAAFRSLEQSPSLEDLAPHDLKLKLVKGLEDRVAKVRAAAFRSLEQSPSLEDLAPHDLKLKLVKGLEDRVAKVRAAAFRSLEQSPSLEDLAPHDLKLKLVKGLEDRVAKVRAAAFRSLEQSPSLEDLAPHDLKLKLVKGLEDRVAKVRAAAFRSLEQSPSLEDLAPHDLKLKLVKGLEDRVAKVRAAAFRSLEQSPSLEDLAPHDLKLKLVKGLEDRVAKVRAAAFRSLEQSPSLEDLATHDLKPKLVKGLEDPVPEVRLVAFQYLGKLYRDVQWHDTWKCLPAQGHLEEGNLTQKLVKGLEDPESDVRAAAFHCLEKCWLRPQTHGFKPRLLKGLEDPVAEVRAAAFQYLSKCPSLEDLAAQGLKAKLVKGLDDIDADVRAAAFECLGKYLYLFSQSCALNLPWANGLQDHCQKVRGAACTTLEVGLTLNSNRLLPVQIKALESLYPDVRDAACRALSRSVGLNRLAKCAAEVVRILDAHWGLWPTHAQEGSLDASIRLVFKVPIEELEERDTWLHIAARGGRAKVCQALLASGLAMKSLRNAEHQTARDVARQQGHADLAKLLRPSTLQTRGGSGAAIAKALDSWEDVETVSWWFIPLPGWEGKLGAVHSMLKVDTGKDQYLIEGACPEKVKPEGVQRPDIEKAVENGLFVSHWAEITDACNIKELTDVKPCRPFGIMLTALVKHLLRQGPYDVGSNNCHHTALHGYNFCAAEPLRRLPINADLTAAAWLLSQVNIDLASSRSCGQQLPFFLPMYAGIPRDETVTLALPRHWTGQVRNGAVDLGKGSDEFLKVEAYFKDNGGDQIPGFQIVDIKRNQSLKMLRTFRNELYDMHEQRQLRVFHSTPAHETVMKEGFKVAYTSLEFNAYGAGIYFAQDLRLADQFAPSSQDGLKQVKQVLLCCVAAGKSYVKKRIFEFVPGDRLSGKSEEEWQSKLRKTEHRQAPDGYDSCVADSGEALIVYRESQVLWEYAIQYESTGSAGNPYGDLRGLLKEVSQN
eukprot:Skav227460  [mRNA]  locus=scaffold2491:255471:258755:+ [translate_table: standard]